MAFRHGRFAEITVNGTALSTFCDSAEINIDVDAAETTTFGKTWKTNIPGLAGGSVTLSGNYDPTASTGPSAVFTGLIGAAAFPVLLHPGGNTSGQIRHSFNAVLTGYSESSAVSDKITFNAELILDGADTITNVA